MSREFWNERYARTEYVYGTEPNGFLAEMAARIPPGPVLSLADGEGRNGVFLAACGHAVTAVDASEVGLAKARQLAASRGVTMNTIHADLAFFEITPGAWAGIVSIFAHLPSALRRQVYPQVVAGLQAGGVLVLEAYTPAQLAHDTGGPRDPDMLMTTGKIRTELPGMAFEILREIERDVREGAGHSGRAAVVQVLARKTG